MKNDGAIFHCLHTLIIKNTQILVLLDINDLVINKQISFWRTIILASGYTRNTRSCCTWEDPVGYSQDPKSRRIGFREYPLYSSHIQLGFVFCMKTHKRIITSLLFKQYYVWNYILNNILKELDDSLINVNWVNKFEIIY